CAEYAEFNFSGRISESTASIDWGASLERVESEIRFQALSMANQELCGISTDQGLYCWNWDDPVPTQVLPEQKFESVSIGSSNTCAIDENAEALCWSHYEPTNIEIVPGGLRFRKIVAGVSAVQLRAFVSAHMCGITLAGE